MKFGFYSKLALDGIRKNKRMYFPYMATCVGMVMMTYILIFLQASDTIRAIRGGETVQYILSYGVWVLAVFSGIFLLYTNSFLMRRRKKEFGLYNVLGMGRGHIGRIVLWENVYISLGSLAVGLACGILFSKLAELGVFKLMRQGTNFSLSVSVESIATTAKIFGVIFLILLLNGLRQVRFSSTVSLLRSETVGEKPPKANWFLGILGIVILCGAYYLAVSIENPVTALIWFFIAVIMVIAATYLLMVSGSVLMCRILQKRKGYYYKANHFVSVSSMAYRMKRNGAGLASICILATMVLVMLSSTMALYAGEEGNLYTRYPGEINAWIQFERPEGISEENVEQLHQNILDVVEQHGTEPENVTDLRSISTAGLVSGTTIETDSERTSRLDVSNLYEIYVIPLEDYNRRMGTDKVLEDGEAMLYVFRGTYAEDTISFNRGKSFTIKEHLDNWKVNGQMAMTVVPSMVLVVPDVVSAVEGITNQNGEPLYNFQWEYVFDTPLEEEADIQITQELKDSFADHNGETGVEYRFASFESRAAEREDFYSLFGGLFYLGILLSIVFVFAAVLIIYYKQISEGYEDQSRFGIMQKVGMTQKEIRKSINSQILTVFFLPLLGAGLHLCFAFPIVEKLLTMFNMRNRPLFIATTLGSFLLFSLFYVVVYRVTSNAYYRIVSGAKK